MEAVPKLPLISFELKVSTENTHFGPRLKQYIAQAYREDPDSYSNEMHQLESLRSAAVRPTIDDTGLSALNRYFCQLRAMQSRFPMAKGQLAACSFSWKDLYANMSCPLSDIRFEMACILYNIGALHTQLASSEPRTSADSLKSACTHYQNAAWAFQLLRDQYPQPPGVDVSTDIMRLLQEICFAQAQECILEKSIQDTRKPSVVGAVATQVIHFYKNALSYLGPSTGTDNIHEIIGTKLYNYWYRYLSFKYSYVGCIVCLYQGMNAEEQQKMGERVAFYQQAVDKLAEARKLAKYIEPTKVTQEALTFTNDVVEGKRKAAKNENEFIYHEEVPEKDLLMDMKPVCLVKALAINFNDPEVSGPDIFSRLIPMGAHEASSVYSEEKAMLLRYISSEAETKTTELTEFMSSLQLDQLEVIDSEQKIPQEVVDRCAAMNAKTEVIQTLVDSMNNLAEIIGDVEESLTEIKNLIQEETLKEKEFQKTMGPRPPSIVQTELSREYHKYHEAHTRTNESNQVLHKAMTLHIANLKLLALPLDHLEKKIPSIDNIEGLDRDTMKEMRRVVEKAREMQTQRAGLLQQLRAALAADDITRALLARAPHTPADDVFTNEIEKHTPKVKIIEQNLAAQENIINKLTSLYASYGESRRLLTDVLRKREGLINALVTSYDSYEELLGKSQKGMEFYKKLSHNVGQLLSRLRSTCQVQQEERAQLLATQTTKTSTPTPPVVSKSSDIDLPAGMATTGLKLKDYLPYMKNRSTLRNVPPQVQAESVPPDAYYPESIYPTSVRPAPVGSEATDPQMQLPDGIVMPQAQTPNLYDRYSIPYAPSDTDTYSIQSNYAYPATSKAYEKPDDTYGYSAYTPPQFSSQMSEQQQIYSNPYYSATHNNVTMVTDSPNSEYSTNPNVSQANMNANQHTYNPYMQNNQMIVPESAPSMVYHTPNPDDLSASFAQMNVAVPKTDPTLSYGADYSQTYYSVQYPQVSTPSVNTYSNAVHPSNTSMVPSQIPSDYSSLNYPYSTDSSQYGQTANPNVAYSTEIPGYSFASTGYENVPQGYPTYTSADRSATLTTSVNNTVSTSQPYTYTPESDASYVNPSLAHLDAIDKPIKSHVTGEALSTNINYSNYQNYDASAQNYATPTDQTYQPTGQYVYTDQASGNYGQNFQNHPGYTFNSASGNYEYSYGSQNTSAYDGTAVGNVDSQTTLKDGSWNPHGVYTSAGTCETVQSPSEAPQVVPEMGVDQSNNQIYYNAPYGYQTQMSTNQSQDPPQEMVSNPQPVSTNYGADMNQSTYMQSGQGYDTSVTYSNNQVSTPKENVIEPPTYNQNEPEQSFNQNTNVNQCQQNIGYNSNESSNNQNAISCQSSTYNQNVPYDQGASYDQNNTYIQNQTIQNVTYNENVPEVQPNEPEKPAETKVPETKVPEPSVFDLLSDIDFSVDQKPLMPEIKVPQISESVVRKPTVVPKTELAPKKVIKEEVIERPAKRDLFSDPSLLNKFTQEVKNLQTLTDSFTDRTPSGLTVLDSKWKSFQDVQTKENMTRSKTVAMQHSEGSNIVTEVIPFDDSRLTLKTDPDSYINASYYKQLAPWCIPIVISKNPVESEYSTFWKAVLENKITCVVCLLSEIEMQGNAYWPTAKGQTMEFSKLKVILDDVTCNVHWTERKLTVACGKTVLNVTHYQINVFPAKIVCSPLVLLADKILGQTYGGRLSNQLGGAWVHCAAGAGRSSVVALLLMVMCQVRAGQLDLCDMLDVGCANLCKHRNNVLEDTKYLADAHRTALFYVQGVLCSGTTMFNGEAVSLPSGAAVLPPVTPTPASVTPAPSTVTPTSAVSATQKPNKFSRESFEEMKQSPGLKSGDMKDPLNFLDPLWSLKKK